MAPGKTPRRPKTDSDWGNLGVKGRKTGVMLKDTGVRDEHGLEPMDGIFSSPRKPSPKQNGATQYSTILEDDSMDTGGSSTMPGPAEILQGARNGKVLLPARSRSPIKTSLGSSPRRTPRRSVGPLSSPSQPASKSTPTRAASNPPQKRSLEYSREETTLSTQVAASKGLGSRLKQATKVSVNGRSIKKAFDLSLVDDDDDDDDDDNNIYDIEDENDLSVTNGAIETNGDIGGSSPLFLNGNDPMLASTGEDFPAMKSSQLLDDSTDGRKASVVAKGASETVAGPKKRRGRPSKEFSIQKNPSIDLDDEQNSATKPKAIRGKAKKEKSKVHLDDPQVDSSREVEQEIAQEVEPEIDQEIAQEIVRETAHDIDAVPPPRKKRKAPKAKIVSRDPNSKMKRLRSKGKARLEQPAADKMLLGISKTQSTYNQRYETPADINTRRTRAGRIIVEPVAFWRGERIIYGDANLDGSTLTLPGIKEIVRNDEVEVSRPHKRSGARKAVAKSKVLKQEEEEDEEEEEEEESERELWETETGVVRAQVMQWDPMTGKYDEENTEEMDVAYAAEAIEMRNISGAEFKFAKTLTLPFFGSGMVDLPPEGAKRVKNSRKMQMIFFVYSGRVTVDVGTPTSSFSIGKGGMWQVPRGNFYSITNLSLTNHARIFFAQGCEIVQDPGFDESQVG